MADTVQKNFRMSPKAQQILAKAASKTGLSHTRIVELSLARYAIALGMEVERAKKFLVQNITNSLTAAKPKTKKGKPRK